jgi:spore coat polysaccharide biosynthesis protein SpsF
MNNADWWAGPDGDRYVGRNADPELVDANRRFFMRVFRNVHHESQPYRVIEFGANIGLNIQALRRSSWFGRASFTAVEVNKDACAKLRTVADTVFEMSALDPEMPWGLGYELAISKGFLIHISPADLPKAYAALYEASSRFILICEYFSRQRTMIEYRGQPNLLWKADFAAELLAAYPDLTLIDYGFGSKLDPLIRQDDVTWYVFEKKPLAV